VIELGWEKGRQPSIKYYLITSTEQTDALGTPAIRDVSDFNPRMSKSEFGALVMTEFIQLMHGHHLPSLDQYIVQDNLPLGKGFSTLDFRTN
jgi:hypothetical protein